MSHPLLGQKQYQSQVTDPGHAASGLHAYEFTFRGHWNEEQEAQYVALGSVSAPVVLDDVLQTLTLFVSVVTTHVYDTLSQSSFA